MALGAILGYVALGAISGYVALGDILGYVALGAILGYVALGYAQDDPACMHQVEQDDHWVTSEVSVRVTFSVRVGVRGSWHRVAATSVVHAFFSAVLLKSCQEKRST